MRTTEPIMLPPPRQESPCCANCRKWASHRKVEPGTPATALAKAPGGCSFGRMTYGSEYCLGHSFGEPKEEDSGGARCPGLMFRGPHDWNEHGFCRNCGNEDPRRPQDPEADDGWRELEGEERRVHLEHLSSFSGGGGISSRLENSWPWAGARGRGNGNGGRKQPDFFSGATTWSQARRRGLDSDGGLPTEEIRFGKD